MLTKQQVIMHRSSVAWVNAGVMFREDMDEPGIQRGITVSFSDWTDMGSPEILTVTLEPGDLLNDDPISGRP